MSSTRRLAAVLLFNLGLVTARAVPGLAAHSLAALAAGADYLASAAETGVSLLAIRPSKASTTAVKSRTAASDIGEPESAVRHLCRHQLHMPRL